jgi:hypothetical protein
MRFSLSIMLQNKEKRQIRATTAHCYTANCYTANC